MMNIIYRKIINDDNQKLQVILDAHRITQEGVFNMYNRLKRDYY